MVSICETSQYENVLDPRGENMKKRRDVLIYVAGAYTGDIDGNILKARKVAIRIWELGFTVLCPHLNTANFQFDCKCNYDAYIEGDLTILKRCDGIFMLKDWAFSNGATIEHDVAYRLYLPVFYEDREGFENLKQYSHWRRTYATTGKDK